MSEHTDLNFSSALLFYSYESLWRHLPINSDKFESEIIFIIFIIFILIEQCEVLFFTQLPTENV